MSKPYTLASERADAPSGCDQLGGQVKDENHTGLQIFADGEWHPVIGWTLDSCGPATDYQEVGA